MGAAHEGGTVAETPNPYDTDRGLERPASGPHRCEHPVMIASVREWKKQGLDGALTAFKAWGKVALVIIGSFLAAVVALAVPLTSTCRSVGAAETQIDNLDVRASTNSGDIRQLRLDLLQLERENALRSQENTERLTRIEGHVEALRDDAQKTTRRSP